MLNFFCKQTKIVHKSHEYVENKQVITIKQTIAFLVEKELMSVHENVKALRLAPCHKLGTS